MKKIYLITFPLILAAILFSFGCHKKPIDPDEPIVVEESYPKEISFIDCSSEYNYCHLSNSIYDNHCVVINSNEELKNYIECWNGIYHEIDFSEYSLLLVGILEPPSSIIDKQLKQISDNEYSLYVKIINRSPITLNNWAMLLKVPKLLQNATITLNLEESYPKEISFIDCSLEYNDCRCEFSSFNRDYCAIINSNEELKNYFECYPDTYPEIEFSEYTLLLARGTAITVLKERQLQQISKNEYSLNVGIIYSLVYDLPWVIVLKVPKLSENATVKLNVYKI